MLFHSIAYASLLMLRHKLGSPKHPALVTNPVGFAARVCNLGDIFPQKYDGRVGI